ncbi:hypothetical protein ILT44_22545 [Microvirga sp. BT689]|uniref:hypothetical protein n=1 Tax=Microvirga arvi TaxID=2778731 RepID=UPI00194E3BC0|nr:hypothetical protein [Microvirga arvi]MBM6582987.1 hypothetical protein [Microvirga arvi]
MVVVSPGHPQLNGKAGVYYGSVVKGKPLLVYPDAEIILPTDPEHVHTGFDSFTMPPSALFLEGDTLSVAARNNDETTVFNVATGAIHSGDLYRSVWFSSWEIAVPGSNGQKHTICRITCDNLAQV